MAAVRADRATEPVRSFGTFTTDLYRLVDWFTECGVETIVMESTSVYWIPIFELLDARGFTVFLVNARDAKHVPGRKTDVSDAQWLQRLQSHQPRGVGTEPIRRTLWLSTSARLYSRYSERTSLRSTVLVLTSP
jgi:transposase